MNDRNGASAAWTAGPPAHMPALDGLRGLAILLVLACHASLFTRSGVDGPAGLILDRIFGAGWIGVDLFFVLSGFLITGILLSARHKKAYYRSFFARRFLRIFPIYYLLLTVLFVFRRSLFTQAELSSLVFYYFNFYAAAFGPIPFVGYLWSLAVEEQFYLMWPYVIARFERGAIIRFSLFGMLAAVVLRLVLLPRAATFQSAYVLTPCRMDELLLGSALAVCRTEEGLWNRLHRHAARVGGACLALLLAIALWTGHFFDFVLWSDTRGYRHSSYLVVGPGITLLAFLFGAMVVKCTRPGFTYQLFGFAPLRVIGKYSYGMYLWHWGLVGQLNRFVMPRIGGRLDSIGRELALFVLLTAASFFVAFLSFNLFERHFLSLKRLFPAANDAKATRMPRPLLSRTASSGTIT